MKSKKFFIYAKKNLAKIKKISKSKIIVIIQENLEELLIIFVICTKKYIERSLQYFIMVKHLIITLKLNN